MKKKEYIKPEISEIEMAESTSILAGSPGGTVNLNISDFDEDEDPTDDKYGYGNDKGTSVWD